MNKLLKIGVPILAAVLVLVIGTGLVLAKEKDTSVLTSPTASYDDDYSRCSQCTGPQYPNYSGAGNGGRWGAVGAVVMVQVQEPVTGPDGLVTMVPTTSRHVTDTEDSFL